MAEKKYIERERIEKFFDGIYDCADLTFEPNDHCCSADDCGHCKWYEAKNAIQKRILSIPAADVRPVPAGGIGEMSDGYHTFNGLYYQRMVLFAALVKAYKDKAWKSWKHEDGELCFGGGWFIVGIDTPQGNYTYHYEDKYWNWFECEELPVAKHWDGHTEKDVTRLLSLGVRPVVLCKDCKNNYNTCLNHGKNEPMCDFTDRKLREDDFCSRGEKREES